MKIEIIKWNQGHTVRIWENERYKYSVMAPLSFVRIILREQENLDELINAVADFDLAERAKLDPVV